VLVLPKGQELLMQQQVLVLQTRTQRFKIREALLR
jgi:hypothetical protein